MAEPALMPIRPVMNSARPVAAQYPVFHPDGHMEMHPREVINDLVRHGTWCDTGEKGPDGKPVMVKLPWSLADPSATNARALARAQVAAAAASRAANGPPPGVIASQLNPLDPAKGNETALGVLPVLDALRKQLADDFGIAADPTWGKAKLQAVIDAKKAGLPVPADSDDE